MGWSKDPGPPAAGMFPAIFYKKAMPYIHFSEQEKQMANEVDIVSRELSITGVSIDGRSYQKRY